MSTHRSVWLATAEQPSFPPVDQNVDVDVAVVGAGITGLTTALLLQRDGARVALIEADRVGSGTTGATTGKVTSQHSLTYAALIESTASARRGSTRRPTSRRSTRWNASPTRHRPTASSNGRPRSSTPRWPTTGRPSKPNTPLLCGLGCRPR